MAFATPLPKALGVIGKVMGEFFNTWGPVALAGIIGLGYLMAYRASRKIYDRSRSMSISQRNEYRRQLAWHLFGWGATVELPLWLAVLGRVLVVCVIVALVSFILFLGWGVWVNVT